MMKKRQFIAGARCPKCGHEDTIVQIRDEKNILFECVQCDFRQHNDKPLPSDNNKVAEVKFPRDKK